MKEVDYKFYSSLRDAESSFSQVPKSVRNSVQFKGLVSSAIISIKKVGRGLKVNVCKPEAYKHFLENSFPENADQVISKASNIRKLRSSKARKVNAAPIFFLRGFKFITLNGASIDLESYTQNFGLFAAQSPVLKTEKICFVENLDTFLKAEQIFGENFLFLHKYGRIGTDSIKSISAREVVVFVDYDFNGLDEYLRIKKIFPGANLYLPLNFNELFEKYSRKMEGNQKASNRVLQSSLKEVIKIRELIFRTNYFLEQEILIYD